MKRILLALAALACAGAIAYAAVATNSPIVGPTETGEWGAMQQQVVDVARFKPGMSTATISISGSAGSGTCNTAACQLTLTTATAGASGVTPSVVTLSNSKITSTSDIVLCTVDQTGATAGAVLVCNAHVSVTGSVTLSLYDGSATALTSSTVVLNTLVLTTGNPN